MRAAFFLDGEVCSGDVPDPLPGKGQALVRTHRCGLCASDAHFLRGGQNLVDMSREFGGPYAALDLSRPFVPGHEYVGEVLDYGPGSRRPVKPGRRVTSIPVMQQGGYGVIGYSHECPGGFGEYMLLDEDMLIEIPSGLDDDLAAMTEPLAVGLEHARRGMPTPDDVALVLGCGAIGLGVIAGLKLAGIAPVIAADFDAHRRAVALRMGADVVLDPRDGSPCAALGELGGRRANLVYECVGTPGMLQRIINTIAPGARIVMGGYCMEPDQLLVFTAQNKRLSVHFAGGEEPQDMELALRSIADGAIDVRPWLGEAIGVAGIRDALARLADPASPIRTVVDPRLP